MGINLEKLSAKEKLELLKLLQDEKKTILEKSAQAAEEILSAAWEKFNQEENKIAPLIESINERGKSFSKSEIIEGVEVTISIAFKQAKKKE